ncbi:MAG: hypothetical protein HND48_02965 [Chloroflexi bacterium]|nr:hypothetical protein [Chloroflexota bacterium]
MMSDSQTRSAGEAAAKFHNTLAEMALAVARAADEPTVILSGGCFQNRLLLGRTTARLKASGFEVLLAARPAAERRRDRDWTACRIRMRRRLWVRRAARRQYASTEEHHNARRAQGKR